ncbi:type II toxin-antitoxin system RelE/ParE family toxin [Caulobacter hibisci]|uniref:Type II toxin-antitoxin system RelE/ParE family toxin n=1 Tax=Caulobacter hibisci TaxID=2035993 RepID=A0ABS0SS71_9CAUL|nr:type II toxin-antitoxin system RelE/ParE family toxin [Caulobacter hibisci]MBI1682475.1 type II toxin-antitoxin system RelE/ParE family toxin [Caulobacter hibisci]
MIEVRQTAGFSAWSDALRDPIARRQVAARVARLGYGHFGDAKAVGEGVSELRIHTGPGYRLYYVRQGDVVIVMLAGGDKSTQDRDIAKAKELARGLPPPG